MFVQVPDLLDPAHARPNYCFGAPSPTQRITASSRVTLLADKKKGLGDSGSRDAADPTASFGAICCVELRSPTMLTSDGWNASSCARSSSEVRTTTTRLVSLTDIFAHRVLDGGTLKAEFTKQI
jgi:hypothetical protein